MTTRPREAAKTIMSDYFSNAIGRGFSVTAMHMPVLNSLTVQLSGKWLKNMQKVDELWYIKGELKYMLANV